jgi:hypothetical protein
MFFPMRLDRFHRNSTLAVLVLSPLLLCIPLVARPPGLPTWPMVLPLAILVVALGVAWAMAPKGLLLKGGELQVIRRAWPSLRLPINSVTAVEAGPSMLGAWRVAGTGGFFGSYGLFYAPGVGRFRLYATRGTNPVTIHRKGLLPVVVTPEDTEAFVEAVNVYRNPEAYL